MAKKPIVTFEDIIPTGQDVQSNVATAPTDESWRNTLESIVPSKVQDTGVRSVDTQANTGIGQVIGAKKKRTVVTFDDIMPVPKEPVVKPKGIVQRAVEYTIGEAPSEEKIMARKPTFLEMQNPKVAKAYVKTLEPDPTITQQIAGVYDAYAKGVKRKAMKLDVGLLHGAAGLVSGAEWAGKKVGIDSVSKITDPTKNFLNDWATAINPEGDDTFADKLAQGIGSSATFFVPGLGVAKGVRAISSLSPRIALWFGNGASAALEAMAEAGSVYETVRTEKGDKAADDAATKTFASNVVLVTLTNKLGAFSDNAGSMIKKVLMSAPMESVQEAGQQIISNYETGRPPLEGLKDSALIGFIVGGGMGMTMEALGPKQAGMGTVIPPREAPEPTGVEGAKTDTTFKPNFDLADNKITFSKKGWKVNEVSETSNGVKTILREAKDVMSVEQLPSELRKRYEDALENKEQAKGTGAENTKKASEILQGVVNDIADHLGLRKSTIEIQAKERVANDTKLPAMDVIRALADRNPTLKDFVNDITAYPDDVVRTKIGQTMVQQMTMNPSLDLKQVVEGLYKSMKTPAKGSDVLKKMETPTAPKMEEVKTPEVLKQAKEEEQKDLYAMAREAKDYGLDIDLNNRGKANNEIDAMIRYLNDKPEEAMKKLGYGKSMQSGGNADFVSQRLVQIKTALNKPAKAEMVDNAPKVEEVKTPEVLKEAKAREQKEADKLFSEARKYKTAEEFISGARSGEVTDQLPFSSEDLLLSDVLSKKRMEDVSRFGSEFEGRPSVAFHRKTGISGDILVVKKENGKFTILDGNNRASVAFERGDKTIRARIIDEGKGSVDSQLTDIWNKAQEKKPQKAGKLTNEDGIMLKKEDFPTNIAGGLENDITIRKGPFNPERKYAIAILNEQRLKKEVIVQVSAKLKELTGYEWTVDAISKNAFHANFEEEKPQKAGKLTKEEEDHLFAKKPKKTVKELIKKKGPDQKYLAEQYDALKKIYADLGPSPIEGYSLADAKLNELILAMDQAEAGERRGGVSSGYQNGMFVEGQSWYTKSTFPEWVDEGLRSRELFDKVTKGLEHTDQIEYPTNPRATAQRDLYDDILDQLDVELDIDTRAIRNNILKAYEQGDKGPITEETKPRATGSEGLGRGGKRTVAEIISKPSQETSWKQSVQVAGKQSEEQSTMTPTQEPIVKRVKNEIKDTGSFEEQTKNIPNTYNKEEKSLIIHILEKTGMQVLEYGKYNGFSLTNGDVDVRMNFNVNGAKDPFEADDGEIFPYSVSISDILSSKKGTGIGTKIINAIEEWANNNVYDVVINNDASDGYWKNQGYEHSRGVALSKDFGGADRAELGLLSPSKEKPYEMEVAKSISSVNTIVTPEDFPLVEIGSWSTFEPEKMAQMYREDYAEHVNSMYTKLQKEVQTPMQQEILDTEMKRFAEGYKTKLIAVASARGNVASTMVTGRAGFNYARNEKKRQTYENRSNEASEFSERAETSIRRKLKESIIAEAGGQLNVDKSELATLEELQASLKKVNIIARNKKLSETEKVSQMIALPGITEKVLYDNNASMEYGVPGYRLTSINLKIKRLREKTAMMEKKSDMPESERTVNGVRVVEDPQSDRIRLYFKGKPEPEVIAALKHNAFKWSPVNGAWQRQLTPNAKRATDNFLDTLGPEKTARTRAPSGDAERAPVDYLYGMGAFAPKPHDIAAFKAVTEEGGVEDFKISDRVKAVIEKYGAPIQEGDVQHQKALGRYNHDIGNIRVRSLYAVSTAVHEAVHRIDHKQDITKKMLIPEKYSIVGLPIYSKEDFKLRKELSDIYIRFYGEQPFTEEAIKQKEATSPEQQQRWETKSGHELQKRLTEGLAAAVQQYYVNPYLVQTYYPEIVSKIILPGAKHNHPHINSLLADMNEVVADYAKMSPEDRVASRIRTGNEVIEKNTGFTKAQRVRYEMFNMFEPLERYAYEAGVRHEWDDPSVQLQNIHRRNAIMIEWVHGGGKRAIFQKDGNFRMAEGSVREYLELIKGKEKQFSSYLLARRELEIHNEIVKLRNIIAVKQAQYDLAYDEFVRDFGEDIMKVMTEQKVNRKTAEMMVASNYIGEGGDSLPHIMLRSEIEAATAEAERLETIFDKDGFSLHDVTGTVTKYQKEFAKAGEMYDMINRDLLEASHEMGLITSENYHTWRNEKGYASFQRYMNDELETQTGLASSNTKSKVKSFQKRTGSSRDIIDPIYSQIMTVYEVHTKGLENVLWQKVDDVMHKVPDGLQKFEPLEVTRIPQTDATGKTTGFTYPQKNDPNLVVFYRNGKPEVRKAAPELIAVAKNLKPKEMDFLAHMMRIPASVFTRLTTTANPFFGIGSNFTVDQVSAAMNTKMGFVPMVDPAKSLADFIAKAPDLLDYEALGAKRQTMAAFFDLSPEDVQRTLLGEKTRIEKVEGVIDSALHILEVPTNIAEMSVRYSEYRKAREAGKNMSVAMYLANEISTPFDKRGHFGGKFGQYTRNNIPYFSASMAVLYKTTNALQDNPKRVAFVSAAVMTSGLAAVLSAIAGASDDQKRVYGSLYARDLVKYLFIPSPDGKNLIRIRIPDQIGAILAPMEMFMIATWTQNEAGWREYLEGLTAFFPEQLNPTPLITEGPLTGAGRIMSTWIPEAIKPTVLTAFNVRTYPEILPIVPPYLKEKRPEEQYNQYTSRVAMYLGQTFGGSPMLIDSWVRGQFGVVGSGLMGTFPRLPSYELESRYVLTGRLINRFYDEKQIVEWQYSDIKKAPDMYSREEKLEVAQNRYFMGKVAEVLSEARKLNNELKKQKVDMPNGMANDLNDLVLLSLSEETTNEELKRAIIEQAAAIKKLKRDHKIE